jgi:helicase
VGDLYDYLDDVIRNLDAVEQMAKAYSKKDIAKNAYVLKRNVEGSG